jgi:hypothetical protein
MGEAKRKAAEWIQLFPPAPARIAISRPSSRPASTRRYESGLAIDIAKMRAVGKPVLCLNPDCDNELHVLPEVRAFLRTGDDPDSSPIASGVCDVCARQDDDALRAMARKLFARCGLDGQPIAGVRVERELAGVMIDVCGVKLAVIQNADDPVCDVALVFARLLEDRLLPRFLVFRHALNNCHAIVDQLRLDLEEIGLERMFAFKRASCGALLSVTDPDGLHSWIERLAEAQRKLGS